MSEYIIGMSNSIYTSQDNLIHFDFSNIHEEIVRCRDCKHGHEVDWPTDIEIPSGYLDCTGPLVTTWDDYHDVPKDNPVEPDGFCKWGERRSG